MTEINGGDIKDAILKRLAQDWDDLDGSTDAWISMSNNGQVEELMQQEFNNRSKTAAFFGTLQAGFTDFHYLRPIWKTTTEKDALIGVGITGIASGDVLSLDLKQAAQVAMDENERVAKLIGINKAARVTTVK